MHTGPAWNNGLLFMQVAGQQPRGSPMLPMGEPKPCDILQLMPDRERSMIVRWPRRGLALLAQRAGNFVTKKLAC